MANYGSVELISCALKAEIRIHPGSANEAIIEIASEDISAYTPNTTMSSQCIPLGAAAATAYSITFNNQDYGLTAEDMDGAKVHVYVSEGTQEEAEWRDFGVWYVEEVQNSEQDPFCTVTGADALNSKFNAKWTDTKEDYPRTLLLIAKTMCAIAGVQLVTDDFRNAYYGVTKMPEWGDNATIRDVISYIAVCAAGFARINYSGQMEIITIGTGTRHTADADYYSTYAAGGKFKFNCLQYRFEPEEDEEEPEEEYTRFAIDGSIPDNASNTIQLSGNPLITHAMANDIAQGLKGVEYEGASITWFGGIDVLPGDELILTDTKGNAHRLILNTYSLEIAGGIFSTAASDMPGSLSETEYFSNGVNAFNPDGTINAEAISGLNQKVISATYGYFQNLTADNITASRLMAAIIEATELWAKNIKVDEIETDKLTAAVAAIIQATIGKLEAGTITTDELYAAFAEIMALKVGTLTAESIEADRLAAALANFVVITAGTATFDLATIKQLISEALILEEGIADSMYITNLAITSANILNATLGNLVIKGEDGNYYRIFVGSDGAIQTEPATVTDDEIAAGQTSTGNQIVETTINTQDLNAQNIRAASALIGEIVTDALSAGKITATEAFLSSATIPALYTTSIQAIGNSMDLSANNSITLNAGGEGLSKLLRLDEKGVHVGQHGKSNEVLIDDATVNVVMNNRKYSQFAADYVQFGNYQLRLTADGGLAFKLKG
jgi:hypothetical protein